MIIINSDDFGASESINRATYYALKENLISSTTALVNFEKGFEDAVQYVKSGKIDQNVIGIHLNLTEGIPLTDNMRNNQEFCHDGIFKGLEYVPTFFQTKEARACVYEELEAQMKLFIEKFGFLPTHIDSHQHVHTKWVIMRSVVRLAKKYNIKTIRPSRNLNRNRDSKKRIYKYLFNRYLRFKGFKTADNFGNLDEAIYCGINPKKNYEIMVHVDFSKSGREIRDMDKIMLRRKLKKLTKQHELKLYNYRALLEL